MKKEIKTKSKLSKIVVSLFLVLVILYAIKNIGLSIFGSKTVGYITSTSQRYNNSGKSSGKRYRNTAYYYFEVDGKKYESHISYKTNSTIVKKQDQEIEKVTVQYFKFMPSLSTLEKYNKSGVANYILWIGLIVFCILMLLSIIDVIDLKKINNKKDKVLVEEKHDEKSL